MKKIIPITVILILVGIFIIYLTTKENTLEETVDTNLFAIWLEKEDGTFFESSLETFPSEGYVFNDEKSYCTNGSTITYDNSTKQAQVSVTGSERCFVYFDILVPLSEQILELHTEADGLIQHTSSIATSAQDNNYRYSGANPNNWVCFGSDEAVCPEENKYRILGIYDGKVKLIKETAAITNQAFDAGDDNRWEGADTSSATDDADINIYLNNTFYNSLPSNYQSMIASEKLNIGAPGNADFTQTPIKFHEKEVLAQTVQSYNIGLMYPSDYFYGASESYWGLLNFQGNSPYDDEYYNNTEMQDNNWVFLGSLEWTIAPNSSSSPRAWYVHGNGNGYADFSSRGSAGRPTIYLKTNVEIISGMGSEADPFRLGM